jgi:adenine phosphoribosyltransferase
MRQAPVGEEIAERFAWVDGHADVWRLFADPVLFGRIAAALAEPFQGSGIAIVCGIESRGFILGGAVARELDVGFAAIRKGEGLYPGPKVQLHTEPDYRGLRNVLRLQRQAIKPGDRVLLVDDWAERGSQARAAAELVARCGGTVAGLSVIVDQLGTRDGLPPVHALVVADDLAPPDV